MSDPTHPVARAGAVMGDLTFDQIRAGLADGSLQPTDHVWAPGRGQWIRLAELSALANPSNPSATKTPEGSGLWRTLGRGLLALVIGIGKVLRVIFKSLSAVVGFIFVITLGLFIGMLLEGRGNPRNNPSTDPLHDPYAGRRDPDFDDEER